MFIYSIRASTLRFAGLMILSLALLTGVLVHARTDDVAVVSYQYHKIKTEEDRVAFLEQFGWKVKSKTPIEEQEFTIPKQFDRVMLGYNEIQKSQGLDLSRYQHKKVTRYTYEIDNYEGYEGKVYANLILYRDKVIGGDICSAEASPGGFVHGFERQQTE